MTIYYILLQQEHFLVGATSHPNMYMYIDWATWQLIPGSLYTKSQQELSYSISALTLQSQQCQITSHISGYTHFINSATVGSNKNATMSLFYLIVKYGSKLMIYILNSHMCIYLTFMIIQHSKPPKIANFSEFLK